MIPCTVITIGQLMLGLDDVNPNSRRTVVMVAIAVVSKSWCIGRRTVNSQVTVVIGLIHHRPVGNLFIPL